MLAFFFNTIRGKFICHSSCTARGNWANTDDTVIVDGKDKEQLQILEKTSEYNMNGC